MTVTFIPLLEYRMSQSKSVWWHTALRASRQLSACSVQLLNERRGPAATEKIVAARKLVSSISQSENSSLRIVKLQADRARVEWRDRPCGKRLRACYWA